MQSADEFRAKLSGEFSAVHGLSVNEYFLLMHLQRAPLNRLSRVELAKRMYVSASTVTRMAAPMEKLELVTREADIRDARLAYVVLSKSGAIRLGEAKVTFAKHARAALGDRWSSAELDSLSKLLNRLVAGTLPNLT
ncbi:MarR family transcriptional regulator [Alphaproteobacteria bacterium AO1-B]|nr:MarR family transcriptional regulator [Alphaproteobacteria bacterium AO1-B]